MLAFVRTTTTPQLAHLTTQGPLRLCWTSLPSPGAPFAHFGLASVREPSSYSLTDSISSPP